MDFEECDVLFVVWALGIREVCGLGDDLLMNLTTTSLSYSIRNPTTPALLTHRKLFLLWQSYIRNSLVLLLP